MEYEFTFVVDGTTVDDDAAVSRLESELDAMLARAGGQDLLTICHEGDTAVEAAMWAAYKARRLAPSLRILRLDRDLVGIPEIAGRTGKTRQCVHQWVGGERLGDGPSFPRAEGTAGRAQVWLWTEVNEWLGHHEMSDGSAYPNRNEMTEIDFVLANSLTFAFQPSPAGGHEDERSRLLHDLLTNHVVSFSQFVAGLPLEKNSADQHLLAIAAATEPAEGVMRFISEKNRDVVLVTATDKVMMGVHFTTTPCEEPEQVVTVPAGSTVWDWMVQVREAPEATFVYATAGLRPLARGTKLTFERPPQAA